MPYLEVISSIPTVRNAICRRVKLGMEVNSLLQKMKITGLVMKLHAFYGIRRSITLDSNTCIFRDVTPCCLVHRRFGLPRCLHLQDEIIRSSEASVHFCRITWRYIQVGRAIHIHLCGNLVSNNVP
jgi:hypothetical protein